jgi:ABC-type Na+ efflux pump permease subunit
VVSAILRKEVTEGFREKHMRMILIVGVIFPLLFGWFFIKDDVREERRRREERARVQARAREKAEREEKAPAGAKSEAPREAGSDEDGDRPAGPAVLGAGTVGFSVGYGMFFAAIFAATLALEAFAGEKERKTIEVLLASPVTDRQLFVGKVAACMLTSMGLGLFFGAVSSLAVSVLGTAYGMTVPWRLLIQVFAYGILVQVALSMTFASLGAVISSRVSTVKGGGQVFGLVMMAIFLLAPIVTVIIEPKKETVQALLGLAAHYPAWRFIVVVLLAMGLLNWILLSLGAAAFSRERILTDL